MWKLRLKNVNKTLENHTQVNSSTHQHETSVETNKEWTRNSNGSKRFWRKDQLMFKWHHRSIFQKSFQEVEKALNARVSPNEILAFWEANEDWVSTIFSMNLSVWENSLASLWLIICPQRAFVVSSNVCSYQQRRIMFCSPNNLQSVGRGTK